MDSTSQALEALTSDEKRELRKHESVIRRGWETFVDVGNALAQIQKDRLYRGEFKTFAEYCRGRWQYGKSQAYRLMGAAEVIANLSPIGDIPRPVNEAQVRPLIGLSAEDQLSAWKAAVEKAGENGVTAKLVREAVAPFQPNDKKPSKSPKSKKSARARALGLVDDVITALDANDLDQARACLGKLRDSLAEPE